MFALPPPSPPPSPWLPPQDSLPWPWIKMNIKIRVLRSISLKRTYAMLKRNATDTSMLTPKTVTSKSQKRDSRRKKTINNKGMSRTFTWRFVKNKGIYQKSIDHGFHASEVVFCYKWGKKLHVTTDKFWLIRTCNCVLIVSTIIVFDYTRRNFFTDLDSHLSQFLAIIFLRL